VKDHPTVLGGASTGPGQAGLALAAWLLALAMLVAGLATGCRLIENHVKDHTPNGCADCHVNITRQWAASGHAEAWDDAGFKRVSANRTVADCLPCHAPEPIHQQAPGEEPKLREVRLSDGVSCRTCHAIGCTYAGPYDSWGPHRMVQDRTRLPCSSFCGTCHNFEQEEYAELYVPNVEPDETPKQCIGCHMPVCTDRLTQGHLLSRLHPERVVHDHTFPAFSDKLLEDAVHLEGLGVLHTAEDEVQVEFTLTNRGAGHRIPTGEYGYRELRIHVDLLDKDGNVLGFEEESLNGARRDGLVPGQPTLFSLTVFIETGSTPASIRLLINRINLDRTIRANLITLEKPLP